MALNEETIKKVFIFNSFFSLFVVIFIAIRLHYTITASFICLQKMKFQHMSELILGLALVLAISTKSVNSEGSGESVDLNIVEPTFETLPKNLYLDLENCYECHHGTERVAKSMEHGCSMSKDDPVSLIK